MNLLLRACLGWLFCFAPGISGVAAPPQTVPPEGLRDNTPRFYALVGARVIPAPGQEIETGTIVVRDGLVVNVGRDVAAPEGARQVDLTGKTVYPGLIDAYGEVPVGRERAQNGAPSWNPLITPQLAVAEIYQPDESLAKTLRSQGITARLVAPQGGIIKGTSAMVLTGEEKGTRAILHSPAALHVRLTVRPGRGRDQYPNSPMGAVALARQTFYDARWYQSAWSAYRSNRRLPRPERNDALAALAAYDTGEPLVLIDAANELFALRADQFAREFGLRATLVGSGDEYRRLAAIRQTGRAVIVPVGFSKTPAVTTPEAAADVRLEHLMHWHLAPENPGRMHAAGISLAFTTHGLEDRKQFLARVRQAVERGLARDAALRALTVTPADLFELGDRLGTIEPGKMANLVVTDGDLFDKKTKVLATWVDGREYVIERPPTFDVRGVWQLTFQQKLGDTREWYLKVAGQPAKLTGQLTKEIPAESAESPQAGGPEENQQTETEDAAAADVAQSETANKKLKRIRLTGARLVAAVDAKLFAGEGIAQLSAVVEQAAAKDDKRLSLLGNLELPGGERVAVKGQRVSEAKQDSESPAKEKKEPGDEPLNLEPNYPLGAFGRREAPPQPEILLLRGATIWTCGPQGILTDAAILIRAGKIEQVGPADSVPVPRGAKVVDVTGKHVTPGIIDCHSHMATDGGINESTQAITAEVRIGDFIDSDDINIYRQLAGGVTTSNILHGSANPIGGQNQVIKLRWGALPAEMKLQQAPQGIKFALGENVKQSNWGDRYTTRYPQTRMGVEQIILDEFLAARDYERRHRQWRQSHEGLPPRHDLELEAIVEILRGKRWIHCHSYRQDEILMLLRLLERFGVTIGSLQHILEGYKVAPEMARHGATGSAFSDWWAYKFEVYDAIPYNGALMHQAGVVVSFNSDDQELARHLNHEAAKAVKYGGVPEEEALKFVTLNPAKQLRIDELVGSLQPGKHADLVVWSGPPLSTLSRCEQTWIDGRRYFDLGEDRQLRQQARQLRAKLVQRVLASGEKGQPAGQQEKDPSELWPRVDIFCPASYGVMVR